MTEIEAEIAEELGGEILRLHAQYREKCGELVRHLNVCEGLQDGLEIEAAGQDGGQVLVVIKNRVPALPLARIIRHMKFYSHE